MSTNAFLDIAIGLVLMYLVLSLMGTVINEFIATLGKIRARTLKNALVTILDNPKLRTDFYDHGLINGTNKVVTGLQGFQSGDHASYFSGRTFAMALLSSLDPNKPTPAFADVKSAIEQLPDCNIRDVLLAQLATANSNLDALRTNVAAYFDTAMDRVSGIYKRYLKWISLGVGFIIVLLLNADSIAVGNALWKDASLRAQMVTTARSLLDDTKNDRCKNDGTKDKDVAEKLNCLENDIRPLPIGWHERAVPQGALSWLAKVLGLIISALAISLGAPFWFDILSKFMNIRGAGPKPQRSDKSSPGTTS